MKWRRGLGGAGMLIDLQNRKKKVRSQKLRATKTGRGRIGFSRILRNPVSEWGGCSGCLIVWLETKDGSKSRGISRENRLPDGKKGGQVRGRSGEEEGKRQLLPGYAEKIGRRPAQESSVQKQLEWL